MYAQPLIEGGLIGIEEGWTTSVPLKGFKEIRECDKFSSIHPVVPFPGFQALLFPSHGLGIADLT